MKNKMSLKDVKNSLENDDKNEKVRVKIQPLSLTINDLVWIITAVVSIVIAWGMYGNRITVLETNQLYTTSQIKELKDDLTKQKEENAKENSKKDKEILELQLKNHISPRE